MDQDGVLWQRLAVWVVGLFVTVIGVWAYWVSLKVIEIHASQEALRSKIVDHTEIAESERLNLYRRLERLEEALHTHDTRFPQPRRNSQ